MSPLEQEWRKWDASNPSFYDLFKRFTFELINSGHKNSSGWLVTNRIRWEAMTSPVPKPVSGSKRSPYKIPNDYIAFFTRKFMDDFPQHAGFFRIKKMFRA